MTSETGDYKRNQKKPKERCGGDKKSIMQEPNVMWDLAERQGHDTTSDLHVWTLASVAY